MQGKQVIINDNFQTKVCNLSTIADLGRAAVLPYGNSEKEILEIDIDDPVYYKAVATSKEEVINYTFNQEIAKPEQQEQNTWAYYKVISPISINELPDNLKSIYPNGLSIGDIVPDTYISEINLKNGDNTIRNYTFEDIRYGYPPDFPSLNEYTSIEYNHLAKYYYTDIVKNNENLKYNFEHYKKSYFEYFVYTRTKDGLIKPLSELNNVGLIPYPYYNGRLSQGISFNINHDESHNSAFYYFCSHTGQLDEIIKGNKSGSCEFKIGVPTSRILREQGIEPPYYYFTNIKSEDKDYYKVNNLDHGIISFGHTEPDDSANSFRIVLAFKPEYNNNTQKFDIFVSNVKSNNGDFEENNKIIIPDWDGTSLKSFYCEYYDDSTADIETSSDSTVVVKLYYKVNEDDTEWQFLKTFKAIRNSGENEFLRRTTFFGNWSNRHKTNLTVNKLIIKSNNKDGFTHYYQDKIFNNAELFFNYVKDKFTFNIIGDISETNKIKTHWFYNKISSYSNSNISPKYIDFGEDYAAAKSRYDLFGKKQKNIKFTANKGTITELDFEGKQIYKINTGDLINLTKINLKNNNLKTLDLSNNINLSNINTENNPELSTIIFPKSWTTTSSNIIINCNNNLSKFNITNENETRLNLMLNLSNTSHYKSLVLRNLYIHNINDLLQNSFSGLQFVDLTNTNILENIDYIRTFVNNLPNRTNRECGKIYLYGSKYIVNGIKGSSKDIADILLTLKLKNWLFYV